MDRLEKETELAAREFDNHVEHGFQLATFQGPLCAEPVEGVAYFVESVEVDQDGLAVEQGKQLWSMLINSVPAHFHAEHNRMQQITGSFISAVRDACRNGLLDWSPRLMLAMYECDIQASSAYPKFPGVLISIY